MIVENSPIQPKESWCNGNTCIRYMYQMLVQVQLTPILSFWGDLSLRRYNLIVFTAFLRAFFPGNSALVNSAWVASLTLTPPGSPSNSKALRDMRPPCLGLNFGRETGLGFVMIYFVYGFPYLCPFLRPKLLEREGHWLPGLLCQNEMSFNISDILSSYFYSKVLRDSRWEILVSYTALVREKLMS